MSSILSTAQQFRAEVLRGDKAMLRQLSQSYEHIARSLQAELKLLTEQIEQAQREGRTVNQDWLRRSDRYQRLIRQAREQIDEFSNGTSRFIETRQRQAINLGQSHAADLIQQSADITFSRLPTEAINEIVGVLEDGTPLSKTLSKLGGAAAGQIRQTLITGLGSGHSVQKIGREISKAIEIPRWKALQLARNETMRAYRSSTLATYAENSDVLDGWMWISTKSLVTCLVCWQLHGTKFPLSVTFFPSHVCCRCTSAPIPVGSNFNVQSGAEAFANLPTEHQRAILGPSRYEMYSRQGMKLSNFVSLQKNQEWGESYQIKPLNSVSADSHVPIPKSTAVETARTNAAPLPAPAVLPIPSAHSIPRTFTNDAEAAEWGKANWQHVKLSDAETDALRRYQSAGYQNVNPYLRGQKNFSSDRAADYNAMIRNVDLALKHQTVPESVVVYRAVGSEAFGELSEKLAGRVFEEKAFMSTALASKVPREFKNKQVVLRLTVPQGTPGYFMPGVATDARMRAERELLLGRGLKYKITSARYNSRSGKWEMDAEILSKASNQAGSQKTPAPAALFIPRTPSVPQDVAYASTRRFSSDADGKAFITRTFGNWKNSLTKKEDAAMAFYQSPGYELMNGQARGHSVSASLGDLERAQEAIKHLDAAIAKAPPLPESLIVYRGLNANQFGTVKEGDILSDAGFTSVSLTAGSGTGGKDQATAVIVLPKGLRVAAGRTKELVLPRGSKFRVKQYKRAAKKITYFLEVA